MNINDEISRGDMVIAIPYGTAEWHNACNASKPSFFSIRKAGTQRGPELAI
jgi:hypothetical protein